MKIIEKSQQQQKVVDKFLNWEVDKVIIYDDFQEAYVDGQLYYTVCTRRHEGDDSCRCIGGWSP